MANNNSAEIIELFSTPIKTIQFNDLELFDRLGKLVYNYLPANYFEQLEILGGVTTPDNLNQLEEFKELYNLIDLEMKGYFNDYLGVDPNAVHMNAMWANVQRPGGSHGVHQHPNSFFSGVVYLDIPKDMGMPGFIHFMDPRPAKCMSHADYTKEHGMSYRAWTFAPKVGMMIIFPSWLEHGTNPYINKNSDSLRISLSFNYTLDKCSINTMKIN